MPVAPFPTDPTRTAIARAYRNPAYVAQDVLPIVPIDNEEFTYDAYPDGRFYTVPNTNLGRRSRPNEIVSSGLEMTARAEWHGLSEAIPRVDVSNAATRGRDVLGESTELLTELMSLGREKRTADLVFDAANYPTGYKVTLSGTSQWNDFTNSNPLGDIENGLNVPLMRPTVMVVSTEVWSVLRRHPDVIKATQGNSGDRGRARREAVAELFELEEVIVGPARINTAAEGQSPTLVRVWGKHCALLYRNRVTSTRRGMTWGLTAQFQDFAVSQIPDDLAGAEGVWHNKVTLCERPVIIASLAGYFIQNAVA